MNRPVALIALAAVLGAEACASENSAGLSAEPATGSAATTPKPKPSETSTAPTTSTADSSPSAKPSASPTPAPACGGVGGIQCPAGMKCKLPDPPNHPDEMGVCVSAALKGKLGGMCAGFGAIQCEPGLVCDMPKPAAPDQAGTCIKPR